MITGQSNTDTWLVVVCSWGYSSRWQRQQHQHLPPLEGLTRRDVAAHPFTRYGCALLDVGRALDVVLSPYFVDVLMATASSLILLLLQLLRSVVTGLGLILPPLTLLSPCTPVPVVDVIVAVIGTAYIPLATPRPTLCLRTIVARLSLRLSTSILDVATTVPSSFR
jgi:hypothetical protein